MTCPWQLTGDARWDAGAPLVIGVVPAAAALGLAIGSRSLLLGQGADPEERERIRSIIENDPAAAGSSELLTMCLCPDSMLLTVHLTAVQGVSTNELAKQIDGIEARIRADIPAVDRISIEVQPGEAATSG